MSKNSTTTLSKRGELLRRFLSCRKGIEVTPRELRDAVLTASRLRNGWYRLTIEREGFGAHREFVKKLYGLIETVSK